MNHLPKYLEYHEGDKKPELYSLLIGLLFIFTLLYLSWHLGRFYEVKTNEDIKYPVPLEEICKSYEAIQYQKPILQP